jgi:hypothetical protein
MCFASVLIVPDLLEDSEGILEVDDTLRVIFEEDGYPAETKENNRSVRTLAVATLGDC